MVDLLGMFRRRPVKRRSPGFARTSADIAALGDSMGEILTSPVRDAPPLARAAPLVLAGDERGLSDRGRSNFCTGVARAIGGASRTGLVSISPMLSPSAVMSTCERANPGAPRLAARRRNMPNKSTIPASFSLSR